MGCDFAQLRSVCVCVCACVCVCVCVCVGVSVSLCMHVCMSVCMYVRYVMCRKYVLYALQSMHVDGQRNQDSILMVKVFEDMQNP